MLKHIVVKKGSDFIGRYAVKMEENNVKLRKVAGQDLSHELLADCLQAVDIDCLARARKLHEKRRNPWRVCRRKGMSGAEDFWVEYLVNSEFKILGKGGKVHISMHGKLNEGIDLPLMDLSPILHHPDFPTGWEEEHPEFTFIVINERDLPRLEDFYPAGADVFGEEEEIPVDEIPVDEIGAE